MAAAAATAAAGRRGRPGTPSGPRSLAERRVSSGACSLPAASPGSRRPGARTRVPLHLPGALPAPPPTPTFHSPASHVAVTSRAAGLLRGGGGGGWGHPLRIRRPGVDGAACSSRFPSLPLPSDAPIPPLVGGGPGLLPLLQRGASTRAPERCAGGGFPCRAAPQTIWAGRTETSQAEPRTELLQRPPSLTVSPTSGRSTSAKGGPGKEGRGKMAEDAN